MSDNKNKCEELKERAFAALEEEKRQKQNVLMEVFNKEILPIFPEAVFKENLDDPFNIEICGHKFRISRCFQGAYIGLDAAFPYRSSWESIGLVKTLADFARYLNFYESTMKELNKAGKQNPKNSFYDNFFNWLKSRG